jgi:L-ascorbate metabolism protein UlaG (beta-lactamase superfamily)
MAWLVRATFLAAWLLPGLLMPGLALACGVSAQNRLLHRANLGASVGANLGANLVSAEAGVVAITFLGHASFAIESPGGVLAVTDFSGRHTPPRVPEIVTMNHAHSTHYTDTPDPRIAHVLRGWRADGGPAQHDMKLSDLRVRNLPTNIRNYDGGTRRYGNSIFVFEAAGLCIAHLGHLHHLLTADDLATLGQLDIVMVPIDGAWTANQGDMVEVIGQLNPRLILPMHYWNEEVLARFLARMRDTAAIVRAEGTHFTVSRATLPAAPTVLVLPGSYF